MFLCTCSSLTLHRHTCCYSVTLSASAAAVKMYQISFGSDGASISTMAIDNKQLVSLTNTGPPCHMHPYYQKDAA